MTQKEVCKICIYKIKGRRVGLGWVGSVYSSKDIIKKITLKKLHLTDAQSKAHPANTGHLISYILQELPNFVTQHSTHKPSPYPPPLHGVGKDENFDHQRKMDHYFRMNRCVRILVKTFCHGDLHRLIWNELKQRP